MPNSAIYQSNGSAFWKNGAIGDAALATGKAASSAFTAVTALGLVVMSASRKRRKASRLCNSAPLGDQGLNILVDTSQVLAHTPFGRDLVWM